MIIIWFRNEGAEPKSCQDFSLKVNHSFCQSADAVSETPSYLLYGGSSNSVQKNSRGKMDHLIDAGAVLEIVFLCSTVHPSCLRSYSPNAVLIVACKCKGQGWDDPIDLIKGEYVTEALIKKLQRRFFGSQSRCREVVLSNHTILLVCI